MSAEASFSANTNVLTHSPFPPSTPSTASSVVDGSVVKTAVSSVAENVSVSVSWNSGISLKIDGPMSLLAGLFQALLQVGINSYIMAREHNFDEQKIVQSLKDSFTVVNEKLDTLLDASLKVAFSDLRSANNHFKAGLLKKGREFCKDAIQNAKHATATHEKDVNKLVQAAYVKIAASYWTLVVFPEDIKEIHNGLKAFALEAADVLSDLHGNPIIQSALDSQLHGASLFGSKDDRLRLLRAVSRLSRSVEAALKHPQAEPSLLDLVVPSMMITDKHKIGMDSRVISALCAQKVHKLQSHTEFITCVSRVTDDVVVSGSYDKSLCVWQISSGKCLHELKGHTAAVMCVSRVTDDVIVSGSGDSTLRVWYL